MFTVALVAGLIGVLDRVVFPAWHARDEARMFRESASALRTCLAQPFRGPAGHESVHCEVLVEATALHLGQLRVRPEDRDALQAALARLRAPMRSGERPDAAAQAELSQALARVEGTLR